ncbi:MAG: Plug domain-containing protein, partial [Myxococcales bacterium]|nr:Plug domain-containing protein [Myxococcales bacterium]
MLLLVALPVWAAPPEEAGDAPGGAEDVMQVVGRREAPGRMDAGRAVETVDRDDLDVLQPRSAPEALRLLGGVSVQQTAAGQASPYIRGRTGQHTLLMFDGLRINHALFRQGPNQYFFTVDGRTIDHIDVVRGSASVELGADALAGAVWVHPLEPTIDPARSGLHVSPRAAARATTADDERGGRVQLDAQIGDATGLLAGVGYRTVGKLEAAGPIEPLLDEDEVGVPLFEKEVPTFADDGRTQLGTGFDELTGDLRLVHRLSATDRLVVAGYLYRQFDAPRTDQCPAP